MLAHVIYDYHATQMRTLRLTIMNVCEFCIYDKANIALTLSIKLKSKKKTNKSVQKICPLMNKIMIKQQ